MIVATGQEWELREEQGFYFLRLYIYDYVAGISVNERFIQVPIGTLRINTRANIVSIILRHLPRKDK